MPVRPWDLLNPNKPRATGVDASKRMDICNACPRLQAGICMECHCVMRLKTTLAEAECPLGKW